MEAWLKRPWGYMHNHSSKEGLWAHSYHIYVRQPYEWDPMTMTLHAKSTGTIALPALQAHRARLNSVGRARNAQISLDEWGSGPPWKAPSMGTPHAIFAAALLLQLIKGAKSLRLASANLYAPVNEGAIAVGRWSASLTPLGEALQLVSQHQGRFLLPVPPQWGSSEPSEVEAVVTASSLMSSRRRSNGGLPSFLATLANCNAAATHTRRLQLPLGRDPLRATLEATELRASGIDPVASGKLGDIGNFTRVRPRLLVACQDRHGRVSGEWASEWDAGVQCAVGARLGVQLELAPFSVVHVSVSLVPV